MSQLVKFNSTPSLLSVFENFWGNDLVNYDMLSKAKLPAVNVKDKEKEYEIEVAAPGFKKEDFSISVENRILTISAEEKELGTRTLARASKLACSPSVANIIN